MDWSPFSLSHKDISALFFVLDMKFASLSQLNRYVWSKPGRISTRYASHRLIRLCNEGYLTTNLITTGKRRQRYYLPSTKAYRTIHSLNPDLSLCKPISNLSYSAFRHDNYVNECRILIESKRDRNYNWRSERVLESEFLRNPKNPGNLKARFRSRFPDAIYRSEKGYVYFELEHSYKSKARYVDKLKKYRDLFDSENSPIAGVLWVTVSQTANTRLWKAIHDLGLHRNSKFSVITYEELKEGVNPYE